MPILDAHEGDLSAASTDLVMRPQAPRPQAPRFSMWGTLTAAPKGLAAGAADVAGSVADVLGAFGSVAGAYDARPGGMFSTDGPTKLSDLVVGTEQERARQKLLASGPDYMTGAGTSFRNVARDYMPDPTTSHAAEQAVGELFRVGTKAVGAAMLLGPVGGAVVSGLEEGFTASDKLAQQGVDLETRAAVGAVTAAVQGASFALPVAGKTWGQTIGLALAGGPTAYVAQQAATRHILAEADYTQLAEQYDPLDPVGLTLSTVLPLGFGAIAMRAARTTHAPAPEAVDAARTALLSENLTASRPVPAEDLAGSAQHEQAYERAMDQLAAGQRVDVSDVAPAGERIVAELSPKLAEIKAAMDEQDARLGRAAEPMPENTYQLFRGVPEGATPTDTTSTVGNALFYSGDEAVARAYAGERGNVMQQQVTFGNLLDVPTWVAAKEALGLPKSATMADIVEAARAAGHDGVSFKTTNGREFIHIPDNAPKAKPAAAKPAEGQNAIPVEDPALDARANALEQSTPDLMVQLEGMDKPAPVGELMARLREELQQDLQEVPLVQAAAECFLSAL